MGCNDIVLKFALYAFALRERDKLITHSLILQSEEFAVKAGCC